MLVVPYAYSVSSAAAARIKAAVAKGAKLILLGGGQGPTDEWGEPRPEPIFKSLVDAGKAKDVDEDIFEWGPTDLFREKVTAQIDEALGDQHPFKLHRYGKKIDATLLVKSPEERFVFLLNWDKGTSVVDLDLPLPEGNYEVLARDENRWHRLEIDGVKVLEAAQFRSLRLALGGKQPYVLFIRPVK